MILLRFEYVMFVFCLLCLIVYFFKGMVVCVFLFLFIFEKGWEVYIWCWLCKLLCICGIVIKIDSLLLILCLLLVFNYVSWLDIFVVNLLQFCCFVVKLEICSWLLIGWLCVKIGIIFILCGKVSDVWCIFKGLVESIEKDEYVVFFFEGMMVVQGMLLFFYVNLFEVVIDVRVLVQLYVLCYVDGEGWLYVVVDFIGDMFIVESIMSIFKFKGMMVELK